MAELGDGNITLQELAKRVDPDGGKIATIIELLALESPMIANMAAMEGNLPTGHRTTMRSGLPTVTWRKLNKGVQPSKSSTVQVDDTTGMLEGYAEVDKAIADLNGNTSAFRLSEAMAFIQAFAQEMETQIIYGDSSLTPEQPLGLAPRFPYKDSPNVVDFGGTGSDLTSLWFVTQGMETCHLIVPKGSQVGLQHMDKGQDTLQDGDGNNYEGYRDWWKWEMGLSLRDFRSVVRCCNIESTGLTGSGNNNITDKLYLLIKAKNMLRGKGSLAIYCNEDVKTQLDVAAYNKTTPNLYTVESGGKHQTMFMGVPIFMSEGILSTEDALIATP